LFEFGCGEVLADVYWPGEGEVGISEKSFLRGGSPMLPCANVGA
jgi:hypothetical protein